MLVRRLVEAFLRSNLGKALKLELFLEWTKKQRNTTALSEMDVKQNVPFYCTVRSVPKLNTYNKYK